MKFQATVLLVFLFASAHGASKFTKESCDRACPMTYKPLCGTDGNTYSNFCVFENALCGVPSDRAFKVAYKGACKTATKRNGRINCERACPMNYQPLCGTDGNTYVNSCVFENALCGVPSANAFKVAYEGPCKSEIKRNGKIHCERACPMNYQPLCGTDGNTYVNACVFENALCGVSSSDAFKVAYEGACKPVSKRNGKINCERACPMIFQPICGTNGVTYNNACLFENALCGVPSNNAFKVAYEGPCK